MKLSEAERGMLTSKMSDDTIASIFGRRVSWVRKAREWLSDEAAKPAPTPKKIVHLDVTAYLAPEPRQIDLEEAIAAAPPLRFGAPAQLEGSDLASWLYDNTDATFAQIGEISGLDAAEVHAIANGDPLPEPAPMKEMRQKIVRRPPAPRKAPAAPALRPDAEIPARVVRWATQFRDAHWTWAEISYLFEVDIGDLRVAMGLDPTPGRRVA